MYQRKPRRISDFRAVTERLYGISGPEEKERQKKEKPRCFLEPPPFPPKAITEAQHERK